MNTTSYFMRVTALQPISHIGKSASTGALFNTEKVRYQGRPAEVPYVTGNAMKGVLRRIGMEVMLSHLGLNPEMAGYLGDEKNPLTQNRLEVLFNGSILSSGERGIKVDIGAKLAELIPWFAIVGGCLGNTMIQGRLAVHPLTLICGENQERLEVMSQDIQKLTGEEINLFDGLALAPARSHLQIEERTHNDDFKGSTLTRYLPGKERRKLLAVQAEDQLARQEPGWQDKDTGNHIQMRYQVQTVQAGSVFFWRIDTFDLTSLMEDAFATTMAYFLARPYVGGNRRQGWGLVSLECLGKNRVEPARGQWSTEVGFRVGEVYKSHLENRKEEILSVIKAAIPEK